MAFFDAATSRAFTFETVTTWVADLWADLSKTPFEKRTEAMSNRVDFLRSLSDGQLAARGIKRDEILQHVFSQKWR